MKNLTITVKPNESKIFPIFWDGSRDEDLTLNAVLDQPGSSLKLLGIFFGRKNHFDLKTNIIHKAPNTFSRTIIKGVLDDTASANYEGMVRIEKGAKNTDADLKAHTILLSKKAKAIAIPRLDVLENEVKAGHGATVGKIDEEQLFYIMSRGLSLAQAKRIIINGFLASLLSEFPEKEAKMISKKLKI